MLGAEELKCLTALVDCLIPADSLGPSATEAGVVVFLCNQLAGDYGAGTQTYVCAAEEAEPTNVTAWAPRLFYQNGIAALNEVANRIAGDDFEQLGESDRHKLLTAIERNAVDHPWIAMFLDQVLLNTMEGYFSDPRHGGNRNAAGWKMVGFPGCGHDYRNFVGKNIPVSRLVQIQTIGDFRDGP